MNNETEQIYIINVGQSEPSPLTQKVLEVELSGNNQASLENVEDFSNVCRTCATITEFVIPIFEGEGLQNHLAEKIHKHLPIQVSSGDVLPRVVCYQCASTLLAWHELVQCCRQADQALRARAQRGLQGPKNIDPTPNSNGKEDLQNKPGAPPQYRPPAPGLPRACPYCPASLQPAAYQKHLIMEHAQLLFHCEECGSYVDRTDFMRHMSEHAERYTGKTDKKKKDGLAKRRKPKRKKDDIDGNQDTSEAELKVDAGGSRDGKEKLTNEFSDHSDTEDGFGPLPESVFEAIEDSQDSQDTPDTPVEEDTSPTPDDGHTSEQSEHVTTTAGDEPEACSNSPAPAGEEPEARSHSAADPERGQPEPPGKLRSCPVCGKQYRAASSYFYHMKYVHRRSREHACAQCGRRFGTRAGLAQHGAVHAAAGTLECAQCRKRFRSKASLYIHSQAHAGPRAWACAQCPRAFRWRAQLQRHVQRHAQLRAHVCDTCGRGFNIRCDLLRHARTHAAGCYTCDKCGLKFAQLRYLKVHLSKKHSALNESQLG